MTSINTTTNLDQPPIFTCWRFDGQTEKCRIMNSLRGSLLCARYEASPAVLFAKPHISQCLELLDYARNLLQEQGIQVLHSQSTLLNPELFYKTYSPHAYFAFKPFSEHVDHLSQESLLALEIGTRRSFEEHLKRCSLLSAREAIERMSVSSRELYTAWEQSKDLVRLQFGYQIKRLRLIEHPAMWVVNGYFPFRFDAYCSDPQNVTAWLLSIPSDTTVAQARQTILGDLWGPVDTLRGYLSAHSPRLGLSFDAFNNGFHMSDSRSCGLREAAIWFPTSVSSCSAFIGMGRELNITPQRLLQEISSQSAAFSIYPTDDIREVKRCFASICGSDQPNKLQP